MTMDDRPVKLPDGFADALARLIYDECYVASVRDVTKPRADGTEYTTKEVRYTFPVNGEIDRIEGVDDRMVFADSVAMLIIERCLELMDDEE